MKYIAGKNFRIYSSELILEFENQKTYLAITEMINFVPYVTYYYELPARFKEIDPIYKVEEHFYPNNPN